MRTEWIGLPSKGTSAMGRPQNRPQVDGSPRGRPRSEVVEQAILESVVRLLEDGVPWADISIDRVAHSAGVGKATIYRRWKDKEELFVQVIRDAGAAAPELPGTSLRDDLVALLECLRQRCLAGPSAAILRNVHSQMRSNPKIWAAYDTGLITPLRDLGVEILRRGQANGEIRADIGPELVIDTLAGPVLLRLLMRPDTTLAEGVVEQLVDSVLDGVRTTA